MMNGGKGTAIFLAVLAAVLFTLSALTSLDSENAGLSIVLGIASFALLGAATLCVAGDRAKDQAND